ncbi:MAG: hypothetical protein ACREL7_05400 [Longimicrobiales bacterium]
MKPFPGEARKLVVGLTVALFGAGCGPGAPAEGEPEDGRAAAATEDGPTALIAGTPPGGLADWVSDIRAGTRGIEAIAAEDPTMAQRTALDLYVGRQEYLEMYYGTNGRLSIGVAEALGIAVMENEARFHELLQLLAATPVDTAAVRVKRDELHAQMDRVLAEAENVTIPLTPPGNPAADSTGE